MALGCSECEATLRLVEGDEVTSIIKASNPMRGMPRSRFSVDYYVHIEDCDCGLKHTIHVTKSQRTGWKDIVLQHVHEKGVKE